MRSLFYTLHPNKCIKELKSEQDGFATVFTAVSHVHDKVQVKVEAYVGQDGITSFSNNLVKKDAKVTTTNDNNKSFEMFMFNMPY